MAHHDVTSRTLLELPDPFAAAPSEALLSKVGRIVRSLSVSVVTTALSLAILALLTRSALCSPATANVVATVAGIGPSFALNRRWAWRRSGPSHLRREVIPFWTYAILSLILSTLVVARAAAWADAHGASPTVRTGIVLAANLGSFAMLWCGQFLLLDRLLRPSATDARPSNH